MPKYTCKNCPYSTNHKGNYEAHMSRLTPCSSDSIHGNIKPPKDHVCKHCNHVFARPDTLSRYIKTIHSCIINEITNNNGSIINIGDHNTANINNITNQIVLKIETPIRAHPTINIDDLSIFEQYLILATGKDPYKNILEYINFNPNKPEYHNVCYKNIRKNTVNIHDGNEWMLGLVDSAIENIISECRSQIYV